MDRWVRTAWNSFWVGLGASAVLIGQAVLSPAPAREVSHEPPPSYLPAPTHDVAPAALPTPKRAPAVSQGDPVQDDTPCFTASADVPGRC